MRRRVLIFINPGVQGEEDYCRGVLKDRDNYISFFKEPYGGLWNDSEIIRKLRPAKSEVLQELCALRNDRIDFSIIIFCGHGFYSTDTESTIINLNDQNELFNSDDFKFYTGKSIIIIDSCRVESTITEATIILEQRTFAKAGLVSDPEGCKRLYNNRILECDEQVIISYSCDIGEKSYDNSSLGGFYSSRGLLNVTKELVRANPLTPRMISEDKCFIFSFPKCHELARPRVQSLSGNKQNPQIEKPTNGTYLPFAIVA